MFIVNVRNCGSPVWTWQYIH